VLKWRRRNILLPGAGTPPIEGQQQGRGTPQEALIHA
jgi:hypothetical protein